MRGFVTIVAADCGVMMGFAMRLGAAAVFCVLAGGFAAVPVEPVKAQGFFDYPFNSSRYWKRDRRRSGAARFESRRGWDRLRQPPPQIQVSGPKYYTYKPDALVSTSFAALAEVKPAPDGTAPTRGNASPFIEAGDFLGSFQLRTLPEVAATIEAYYSKFPKFIWVGDDGINGRARVVLAALERADNVGLSSPDYLVDVPADGFEKAAPTERHNALVQFELELSAKALTFVLDTTRGRIDPNRISGYHDFERKDVDLTHVLNSLALTVDVGAYLVERNPDNPPFRALAEELAKLRAEDDGDRVAIAAGTFLKPGSSSPELSNVVGAIRLAGSDALKSEHAATLEQYSGGPEYTPELVALVTNFQKENGLTGDGIIGKNTIRALVPVSVAEKIAKVELAMERLRWLPRQLGQRHVFINQPAFTATYMHKGKDPLSMRAVVGKKSNQTNFFADKIETVEYNPYWGVPRSIIVNEMVPQLYSDPSYLDRQGFEVTTASGTRVSSASVDWYSVASNSTPINVRQPPGKSNALGTLKILFPNKHAIYMHDTPAKNLFAKDVRAFSHGCVRLQDPWAMAAAVLGKTTDYINSRIAEGHNDSDTVAANIPIYVSYFTAWPTLEGDVKYYNDMYDRDVYLTRAIERTVAARHAEG